MPTQYAIQGLDDFTCNISCEEYYGDGDCDVDSEEADTLISA